MINQKLRGLWDRFVKPLGAVLARRGVSPDVITLLGLVIQIFAAAAILDGRLLLAGLISVAAQLADVLDGAVAKAMAAKRRFGALLDSTIDRLTEALMLLPLTWLYGVAPDTAARDQPWVAALALAALVSSFLVSYIKARAEGLGYDCSVGIAERFERVALVLIGLLFDIVPVTLAVLTLLAVITFVQRLVYVRRQGERAV